MARSYLSTYSIVLVITSHSQDFMDSTCTNIMDLTPKKKLVIIMVCEGQEENEVNQMKAYKKQEEITHIKKYAVLVP